MKAELKELYQQVILDHNKNPRNFKKIENANHSAEGYNPLCGDKINIYINLENEIIENISFLGSGCAISKASGSLMTSILKGKTKADAEKLFEKFQSLITGKNGSENEELGKLNILSGVKEFPTRVKCASLPWHTMISALKSNNKNLVTTE